MAPLGRRIDIGSTKYLLAGMVVLSVGAVVFEVWAEVANAVKTNWLGIFGVCICFLGLFLIGYSFGKQEGEGED